MGDEHLILLYHDRDHFLGEMFGIVERGASMSARARDVLYPIEPV